MCRPRRATPSPARSADDQQLEAVDPALGQRRAVAGIRRPGRARDRSQLDRDQSRCASTACCRIRPAPANGISRPAPRGLAAIAERASARIAAHPRSAARAIWLARAEEAVPVADRRRCIADMQQPRRRGCASRRDQPGIATPSCRLPLARRRELDLLVVGRAEDQPLHVDATADGCSRDRGCRPARSPRPRRRRSCRRSRPAG